MINNFIRINCENPYENMSRYKLIDSAGGNIDKLSRIVSKMNNKKSVIKAY